MTTTVQFLQAHSIGLYDFPGAVAYQGGYQALDIVGLPDNIATAFIGQGIAQAAPAITPPAAPTIVKLIFQTKHTVSFADSPQDQGTYQAGDVGGFPQPLANALVALGVATVTS